MKLKPEHHAAIYGFFRANHAAWGDIHREIIGVIEVQATMTKDSMQPVCAGLASHQSKWNMALILEIPRHYFYDEETQPCTKQH